MATHNQVLAWLQEQGIHISITTLKRRLQIWWVHQYSRAQLSDELAERS